MKEKKDNLNKLPDIESWSKGYDIGMKTEQQKIEHIKAEAHTWGYFTALEHMSEIITDLRARIEEAEK